MDHTEQNVNHADVPLLPLRDVVVYPHMVIPLFVGREKSIEALQSAMRTDKQIVLVAQKKPTDDDPSVKDLYRIGTLATILQLLKLPDGTVKVLVEGGERVSVDNIHEPDNHYRAAVTLLAEVLPESFESEALVNTALEYFSQYVKLSRKVPSEVMTSLNGMDDLGRLADTMAAHITLELAEKQKILEIVSVKDRMESLLEVIDGQMDLLQVEKKVRGRVKKQMEKSQREYYLNEQIKAIQKELGDLGEEVNEIEALEKRAADSGMPEEALEKTHSELKKLKMMSPMSAEASVVRAYIDWMLKVPWKKRSQVRNDLAKAEGVLEKDHYGLEEVKERILEYLAVQKRVKKVKGPILCLVGPPGVGKTSLGQSIARATNRKFVRMALGGVRDEAEIRGHRRTYIGSLPGKLIQKMSKAGVKNPLFLLDEIDKMGMDNRGDPASALLEVLDPEQNSHFNDHYLEVDYDLSDVMFVCTSNTMNIPGPLLDRMEVIRIPGYTEDEKLNIATRYLVPKQIKDNGLTEKEISISDDSIRSIVRYYTREAGVRGLDREIAKLCRKVVTQHVKSKSKTLKSIDAPDIESLLGVRKYDFGSAESEDQIGQVTGLAWTQVGGELLTIECSAVKGKGQIIKTGSLGDVMQESIQAAITVVRSRAQALGISPDYYANNDVHIHVPEGATPKDGPSAGVGMCTTLVSVLTGIPVRADVAMTGEITLRGEVLRIGGLKEKLLAAHRGGIKTVIIPAGNERDLKEIPDNIKADLSIRPVKWIDDVLQLALVRMPKPLSDKEYKALEKEANASRISTH